MFGRQKSRGGAEETNLLDPVLGAACRHYLAGPGLHVGLRALLEGADADWDDGAGWSPERLHRVLIVYIAGSLGWVSFLERPEGGPDAALVDSGTRMSNPLTVKFATLEVDSLTASDLRRMVEAIPDESFTQLGPVEVEVRASMSDSEKWNRN